MVVRTVRTRSVLPAEFFGTDKLFWDTWAGTGAMGADLQTPVRRAPASSWPSFSAMAKLFVLPEWHGVTDLK